MYLKLENHANPKLISVAEPEKHEYSVSGISTRHWYQDGSRSTRTVSVACLRQLAVHGAPQPAHCEHERSPAVNGRDCGQRRELFFLSRVYASRHCRGRSCAGVESQTASFRLSFYISLACTRALACFLFVSPSPSLWLSMALFISFLHYLSTSPPCHPLPISPSLHFPLLSHSPQLLCVCLPTPTCSCRDVTSSSSVRWRCAACSVCWRCVSRRRDSAWACRSSSWVSRRKTSASVLAVALASYFWRSASNRPWIGITAEKRDTCVICTEQRYRTATGSGAQRQTI